MFPTKSLEISVSLSPQEALKKIITTLRQVGKVSSFMENSVKGEVRYGLQRVHIVAQVTSKGVSQSLIIVTAKSDDIWGKAAQSGLERFHEEFLRIDSPNTIGSPSYTMDGKTGNPFVNLAMIIAAPVLIFLLYHLVMWLIIYFRYGRLL